MATPDIEAGRPPNATRSLFPPYLEEPITSLPHVPLPQVPKTLIAQAATPLSTTSIPIDSNGPAGITPTPPDTVYKINIGDVQDKQGIDTLPAPFFSMGSLFKLFTSSRQSSAESGAAFLPPGADQC